MKVHQTLVWLNLLSLGTLGLTEPTIGIQSGLCHGRGLARTACQQHSLTTLIRHFVSIKPAYTVLPSCLSQQYCVSVVRELKTCRPGRYVSVCNAGRASTARRAWDLAHTHQRGERTEDLPARPVRVCVQRRPGQYGKESLGPGTHTPAGRGGDG
jgi:hypothetical protein